MRERQLSIPTLKRLPLYCNIAQHALDTGKKLISSSEIADCLNIDSTQVRKDIAAIGYGGKPRVGFDSKELVKYIKKFLGLDKINSVILIGAGNLGIALARYKGFLLQGINITVLFDNDPKLIGSEIDGKRVLSVDELENYISENKIKIAILTVPASAAQEIADKLCSLGIKGIWNFAPFNIVHPKDVIVWNQDLVSNFITFMKFVKTF